MLSNAAIREDQEKWKKSGKKWIHFFPLFSTSLPLWGSEHPAVDLEGLGEGRHNSFQNGAQAGRTRAQCGAGLKPIESDL
jgi:hypothetical protein